MARLLSLAVLILMLAPLAARDRSVYLYSRASAGAGGLRLADVGAIDADAESAASLGEARFDEKAFADGFVDRDEVAALLRSAGAPDVIVRGAGVRVTAAAAEIPAKEVIVPKGGAVKFVVITGAVRITVPGTAAMDGAEGDTIGVKLRKGKTLRGVVRADGSVETRL